MSLSSAAQDHLELEACEEHALRLVPALWHLPQRSALGGFCLSIASADQAVCPARILRWTSAARFHLSSVQRTPADVRVALWCPEKQKSPPDGRALFGLVELRIAGLRGPIGAGRNWRQLKVVAVWLVGMHRAWRVGCCDSRSEGEGGDNPSCCDANQCGAERAAHKQAGKPTVLLGAGHGKSPPSSARSGASLSDHRRE